MFYFYTYKLKGEIVPPMRSPITPIGELSNEKNTLFTYQSYDFLFTYRDLINFGKEGEGVFLTDVEKTAMAYVCWSVAAAAAFVGTYVGTHLGRKGPTVVACSLFITGEVMSAGSRNIGTMLFGKVFMGISLGLLTTTTPIYLAELAPSSRRSTYIMFWVTMLACGEVCAFVSDLLFEKNYKTLLPIKGEVILHCTRTCD